MFKWNGRIWGFHLDLKLDLNPDPDLGFWAEFQFGWKIQSGFRCKADSNLDFGLEKLV